MAALLVERTVMRVHRFRAGSRPADSAENTTLSLVVHHGVGNQRHRLPRSAAFERVHSDIVLGCVRRTLSLHAFHSGSRIAMGDPIQRGFWARRVARDEWLGLHLTLGLLLCLVLLGMF